MKRLISICLTVLLCICVYSQNCVMNEEAKRYYDRGVTATQIAKSADDYKKALAEYQKAADLCADCSELYYRMGLCCELIGEDDNSYYASALKHFKKSLAVGNDISQELKDLIQGKINGMEYAVEQAAAANKDALIPENLCGRWIFHASDGKTNKQYDITISENQGLYSAKFTIITDHAIEEDRHVPTEPSYTIEKRTDISFIDNTICFSTIHNRSHFYSTDNNREVYYRKVEYNYELVLENGILKGICKCVYNFEGTGNSDYRTVMEAVKNGYGRVLSNCAGNCGTSNVYFTRKYLREVSCL